jgi:hypothetical protein
MQMRSPSRADKQTRNRNAYFCTGNDPLKHYQILFLIARIQLGHIYTCVRLYRVEIGVKYHFYIFNASKMTPQVCGVEPPPTSEINVEACKKIARASKVPELQQPRVWNTKNLGLRLASDFTAGFTAACIVAPLITIIDKFVLPYLEVSY